MPEELALPSPLVPLPQVVAQLSQRHLRGVAELVEDRYPLRERLARKVNHRGPLTLHLEALLLKRGNWKIMMEYQKSKGTEDEWNKLK